MKQATPLVVLGLVLLLPNSTAGVHSSAHPHAAVHNVQHIRRSAAVTGAERVSRARCVPSLDYGDANGIALDPQGHVYVASVASYTDAGSGIEIQKRSRTGTLLATWTLHGAVPAHLRHPTGIAVDAQATIYVVSPATSRIYKVSATGTLLASWGSKGEGSGQLASPVGVAVDGRGHVYVTDRGNNRIQIFSATGTLLAVWGKKHDYNHPGQFALPAGIAVDAHGRVYVADENSTTLILSPAGKTLTAWGSKGDQPGQFRHPVGIAVDTHGRLYVADKLNIRIQIFSADGTALTRWLTGDGVTGWFSTQGPAGGQLAFPTGIVIDPAGNSYVVEGWCSSQIQKFSPTQTSLATWALQ